MSVIDARELTPGTVLSADVCILGAGAAGITVTRDLMGRGLDVVLVESGGFEPDADTQALNEGDIVGAPLLSYTTPVPLSETRLRFFGGTTNHWAGYCRPLAPVDFERRDHLAVSGWPFGPDELAPWYDAAVEVLRLNGSRFDLDWARETLGPIEPLLDDEELATAFFQVHYPFSFGGTYRDTVSDSPDVRLLLWANATDLEVEAGSDRVQAANLRTLGGVDMRVEARVFVVALGGIETPRLLLSSDSVRPAGLGNSHDLVGRHFSDHLQVMAGFMLLHRSPDEVQLFNGTDIAAPHPDEPTNQLGVKAVIRATDARLRAKPLLGMEAQMLVAPTTPDAPIALAGLRTDDVAPLLEAQAGPAPTTAYVQVLAEQELQPDSRVTLTTERDAVGMRRVAVDWRHSSLDRSSIVDHLRLLGGRLATAGTGRLQLAPGGIGAATDIREERGVLGFYTVDATAIDLDGFPIGIGYHHLCTARMAASPREGVVDADCRLHEATNVYLAGSSVFATPGAVTPTYTIVALALRLGHHLRTDVLA